MYAYTKNLLAPHSEMVISKNNKEVYYKTRINLYNKYKIYSTIAYTFYEDDKCTLYKINPSEERLQVLNRKGDIINLRYSDIEYLSVKRNKILN